MSNDPCVGKATYSLRCSTLLSGGGSCKTTGEWATSTASCITISVTDYCDPPNVLTGLKYTDWSYEQRRTFNATAGFSTKNELNIAYSNYITIQDTVKCAFTQCKIVAATSSTTCPADGTDATTLSTPSYFTAFNTAPQLDLLTDTSLVRAKTYYCMACLHNNFYPNWVYSLPFSHEVTETNCVPDILLTAYKIPDYN